MKIPTNNDLALKSYKEHQRKLNIILDKLEAEYKNFINKDKIIILLDFYLYSISVSLFCYKKEGLEKFLNSNNQHFNDFASIYENIDSLFNEKKITTIKLNKIFLEKLLDILPHLIFAGAPIKNIYEKILLRISESIIISLPTSNNHHKKERVIKILLSYFGIHIPNEEIKLIKLHLKKNLPKVFWSEPIEINSKNTLNIKASPYTFCEFGGQEGIFLMNKKIFLEGHQHGGGYFTFKKFIYEEYETKISDKYFGWGLSKMHNFKQQRFTKNKLVKSFEKNKRDIIWIESGTPSKLDYFFDTDTTLMAKNQQTKDYIYNELIKSKKKFYNKPHIKNSSLYNKYKNLNIINKYHKAETFIFNNSIIIFDITGSTLVYHCIEQYDTIFIIVTSKEDLDCLSQKQLEWYEVLRKNDLWFFSNEINLLSERVREIVELELKLPDNVKKYHKKIFKLNEPKI